MAIVMAYEVEDLSALAWISTVCWLREKLHYDHIITPIWPEDHALSVAGAVGVGPATECPWCHHTDAPAPFFSFTWWLR